MWWSRRGDISFSDNLSKWIYRRLKHNAPPPLDCNHMHSQHLSHGYSAAKENCHVCSLLEPNSIFWRELRWTVNVSPLLAPWCNKISPNFRQIVFCNISSWRDFPSTLGLITKLVGKKKKKSISALSAQPWQALSISPNGWKMWPYASMQGSIFSHRSWAQLSADPRGMLEPPTCPLAAGALCADACMPWGCAGSAAPRTPLEEPRYLLLQMQQSCTTVSHCRYPPRSCLLTIK